MTEENSENGLYPYSVKLTSAEKKEISKLKLNDNFCFRGKNYILVKICNKKDEWKPKT